LESAQKPLLLPLSKGTQQPVSQSVLVEQSGRQPPKLGLSDWMQEPRQQSVGVSRLPALHASPCFLQGVVQAVISAQIGTPVSLRSVQQPVLQSDAELHGCSQRLPPVVSTQLKPSQQDMLVQPASLPTQRPASALGLEQLGVSLPAAPVQKQEACSNVMQV
jgi:hypothetical protein